MKEINLTQGKVALVDDEDFDWLNQWRWRATKNGNSFYAIRSFGENTLWMHREIMQYHKLLDKTKFIDHINNDGLNNQKHNLRNATFSENYQNGTSHRDSASIYKGVGIQNPVCRENKWRAQIFVNKKKIYLGTFKEEIDAAIAYNEAAQKYFGEFANLNTVV